MSLLPGVGRRPLFPLAHWSTPLRRTFWLISLQDQEDRRRREEYSLGADLEDVDDLRPTNVGEGQDWLNFEERLQSSEFGMARYRCSRRG